jgi:hypothetical protein
MSCRDRIVAAGVAGFLAFGLSLPASAAAKPITGKLDQSGYTVIALASSGKATTDRAPTGEFRLRPPAPTVTLHLRTGDGTYAGPIVLAKRKHGKRAVVGVKAGAKLGTVDVRAAEGYAKVTKTLPESALDVNRLARAQNGVPIGAGNFGQVRVGKLAGPSSDLDLDGVPTTIDVDDDGDLLLDNYDRSIENRALDRAIATASESTLGQSFPDGNFLDVGTSLPITGVDAVNVNGGSSDQQIAAQQERGSLGLNWIGVDPDSGELDCGGSPDPEDPSGWIGGLSYCTRGGTGRLQTSDAVLRQDAPPFPGEPGGPYDLDGDGFGSFTQRQGLDNMTLFHGATADQIRAGDVLIERATINGEPVQFASTVGFVYSTFPVVATYNDGQGDSGGPFTYPSTWDGSWSGGSEIDGPLPVRAGLSGDVIMTMEFWRPQRRSIQGDPDGSEWMDVGNLAYAAQVGTTGPSPQGGACPESSYSNLDPDLIPDSSTGIPTGPPTFGEIRYADQAGDQPQNTTNTFTFTLNVTQCLASKGASISTTQPTNIAVTAFTLTPNGGPPSMAASGFQVQLQP